MSKKNFSPNDSLQQSTTMPSTRSGDRSSLETSTYPSRLLSGGAQIGGGSMDALKLDHLDRMHRDIEATTRKWEVEQRKLFKLDQDLQAAEAEYKQKRNKGVDQRKPYKPDQDSQVTEADAKQRRNKGDRCSAPPDDALHEAEAKVKKLEKELQKAHETLNDGTHKNEQLRAQIDQLRRERLTLNEVFRKLQKEITSNKKSIHRCMTNLNEEKLRSEGYKQQARAESKRLELDRKAFHDGIKKLKEDVLEDSRLQREHDKSLNMTELAQTTADDRNKKKSYTVADEEEAFSETVMYRRILKLSFLNTIQRRHINNHQKNIEVFEQAFRTIKFTTGYSDIEEIVEIFLGIEQRNYSLLTYVNGLNREIEAIEIRNQELHGQMENYNRDLAQSTARKNAAVSETMTQVAQTKKATEMKEQMFMQANEVLEGCQELIWNIVLYLRRELPELVNMGYEGDLPVTNVKPPDEHDDNLNNHLMYIEEALLQFRGCLGPDPARVIPPKPVSSGRIRIEPPQGDDDDDDFEDGMGETKPLTLQQLREKAMSGRRSKRKGGQPGNRPHGDRVQDLAEDLPAPVSKVENDTTRREAGPPPLRDHPPSYVAKEASIDNGMISANPPSTSKSPSARPSSKQQAPDKEQLVDDDSGDRKEMWWRNKGDTKK